MSENKDFKTLVIFGIVMMFVFSSVTAAGISVSNTKIKNIIDEKDNYDEPSGLISKIVTWFRSFFGRDGSSEQSSRTLDSSENEPYYKGDRDLVWDATLVVTETSGKNDNSILGEASDASDGQDYNDAPDPGGPPSGDYLNCYFTEPFGNYMQDIKHYSASNTYKVWNLSVDWVPDGPDYGTNVTLSWDIGEIDDSEYNKITLRRKGQYNSTWYNVSDMLSVNSFSWDHESFYVDPPGFWYWYLDDEFMIICEYIEEPEYRDFGDAPEGLDPPAIAYPSTMTAGAFPTCKTVGPSGWIQHNNFGAWFGPTFDFELDGNGGFCPSCFPLYDQDECFIDSDAGLIIPDPFTIDPALNVIPCPSGAGTLLGLVGNPAVWGVDIDIDVTNFMPSATTGYVNVLMDWNQNGMWGDPGEHVLVNFPVPNGYTGPLSMLVPPGFTIGPNPGYVWSRFSITEVSVPAIPEWNGEGDFEDGETEDYLLKVSQIFTLSITYSGTGSGSVNAVPAGPYYYGDVVTLTANAATGSHFVAWTGDLTGFNNPDTITMDGNKNVDAQFDLDGPFTLSITYSGTGSGSVNAVPAGPYYYGDVVTLTANAATGSHFVAWTGDLTGFNNPDTITMDGNKNVDAQFDLDGPFTLSITYSGTGSGSVNAVPAGPYYYGDVVTLTANAATGSHFVAWTGDLTGFNNPDTITMDGNKNVDAQFDLDGPFTLSITYSGTGSGSVNAVPAGPYYYGDVVTLTANAATGSHFVAWTGDLTGFNNPDTITMDGNKNVDAQFDLDGPFTLSITYSGTGSGSVNAVPAGPYYYGDVVTLTANAATGSHFVAWTGDLTGFNNPDTITMDGNKNVDAQFDLDGPFTLSITYSGTGSGSVNAVPAGPYYYGDVVTLTANAATGSHFVAWTGDLTGFNNPDTITMDGNKNVDAQFDLDGPFTLSITYSGTGSGSVNAVPAGPYYYGDVVTLTANAATGSHFVAWTGDLTGFNNPDTITMDGNKNVDAQFDLDGPFTLSITYSGTGSGSVNAVPAGPYYYGDVVTLTANAATGSHFVAWTGDLTGFNNPDTITMDGNKNVDAQFDLDGPFTLSITYSGTGSGSVNAVPAGPYYYGDVVTLTANAATGSHFVAWTGDLTGFNNPDTITMDGNKNVDAQFDLDGPFTLSITYSGTGSGLVNAVPAGPYYYGDVVTLTANAATGSHFVAWTGDLTGFNNPDTITMDGNKNVDAQFDLDGPFTLSITYSGTGSGLVNAVPAGPYYYGDVVTLTANAATGSHFVAWTGDLTGFNNPDTITMDGNKNVDAQFDLDGPFTLSITYSGTGSGSVNAVPAGPYYYGDVVTLTANAATGSHFVAWTGDLTGFNNPDTITMDGNKNVDAEFTFMLISVNISLKTGWNMITIPVNNTWMASTLAENITGCQMVSWFDAEFQILRTHIVGVPAYDFPIQDGFGYFILVDQNSTFSVSGLPLHNVSVQLYEGWNMIGWYNQYNTTASTLAENITNCSMVSWFDAEFQILRTHIVGVPGYDFDIDCGMGLFILVDEASIWNGEG